MSSVIENCIIVGAGMGLSASLASLFRKENMNVVLAALNVNKLGDLKRELGFSNKYFEKKMYYLLGYTSKIDNEISENSILDFHLAHKTNPKFSFEPKESTNKIIWKYLSSANLLDSFEEIDINDLEKIADI